ncbi:hypothetical protein L1277_000681 [Okibacterium sp. HSC-33S16]|uniref:DUF6993 domain-containing protein n=1 Tax=Okibacterium sp. HSC-33S16 TaxID=2910965 RepID=UPI0020A1E134|nr:hypothetical protein [Okibacterium sp. HSC-33S16]MCP2030617.1 hypothetical protein [Okibacterium sp. HSC-33S16]
MATVDARFTVRVGLGFASMSLIGFLLVGCSMPQTGTPSPKPSATESQSPEPQTPVLVPSGSAEDNLPFFDLVNTQTLAVNPTADGRAFIDDLVAAGFDKAAMEVTSDTTTIGNAADSIQFSVQWGESCLIGQNGPGVGGYHSTVDRVLGTGTCLIGKTRPIDW